MEISKGELQTLDRLIKVVSDLFDDLDDDPATVGTVHQDEYDLLREAREVVNEKLRPHA